MQYCIMLTIPHNWYKMSHVPKWYNLMDWIVWVGSKHHQHTVGILVLWGGDVSIMLNHSSESSNETRNISFCGIPQFMFITTVWNLNCWHPTAGTKVAIETTDYTVVVLDLSVQLTLPFPRFCNWISTKPCGKTCLVMLIHCAVLNPGLILHIIYSLIVFIVNFLLGGELWGIL